MCSETKILEFCGAHNWNENNGIFVVVYKKTEIFYFCSLIWGEKRLEYCVVAHSYAETKRLEYCVVAHMRKQKDY